MTPAHNEADLYIYNETHIEIEFNADYTDVELFKNLIAQKNENAIISEISGDGRILGFEIGISTHDGAPMAQSIGFVDLSDIPPFDCWFYVHGDFLLSWIPEDYIKIMQSAIDVELLDSYFWLDKTHPELNHQLLN